MNLSGRLIEWLKSEVRSASAKGCVFGLSGGIDSAVVGALCKKAFPHDLLALLLPCHSRAEDLLHAKELADKFAIPTKTVDLSEANDVLYKLYEEKDFDNKQVDLASANLRPRLRMLSLYYYANKLNYLVVGTGNKSEAMMGYFTKYGDGGVDLLPLANLIKTQVRALAQELGVPPVIIDKKPSAGLWPGQTDEEEMGITYDVLDKIIIGLEKKELTGLEPKLVGKVKQKIAQTEHKRRLPLSFLP
jgi:NAD+ synthase